ncbi:MAG: type II toxin-antitoxin system death-on-curing family toxin [Gammaproteobacteria bacterium]|nr:type II toxin-antitoxin system death-on-curing family toxin [Gammaproteobacteria bacterium]
MINWITEEDALVIHRMLIEIYGGPEGVRDFALLQSSLAKSKNLYFYSEAPSLNELAASYIYGIVKNHPFVDGNKRVGFVVGESFLRMNGFQLEKDNDAAANIILALAAGDIDEVGLVEFLDKHAHPI